MSDSRRVAPHPEWVAMYRRGIPPSGIAVLDSAPVTTVRYHLQVAKKVEPGLEAEHAAALPEKTPGPSEAVLEKMQDLISFYRTEGRLPLAHAGSSREQTLSSWLYLRRRESA